MTGLKIVLRELGDSSEREAEEAGGDAEHGRSTPTPQNSTAPNGPGAPEFSRGEHCSPS
ncbi:hypothetical protein ITI46_23120 [Streptomyces oryzae]|uniref:Uncharacterized protein n=1 Tax=Streptomyces oryzae TaxID=1434886 RepID=A0ABS3XHR4_9ACTN|nr:hypothetical protein [Streptomyces oryzae]MBO8194527.1 hypothetical protein [Streptomyces oryzae]